MLKKPTTDDAIVESKVHDHFCSSGKTVVKIEPRTVRTASIISVEEYVTEGVKVVPEGTVLFKMLNIKKEISEKVTLVHS